MTDDLYEELGVSPDATTEEIVAAGRRRAKQSHPDAGGSPEEFGRTMQALTILRDPAKRRKYDTTGEQDDDPSQLPHAQALTILAHKIGAIVADPHLDPATFDLVAELKRQVSADREAAKANIAESKAHIRRLGQFRKRLHKKDGTPSQLVSVLDGQIADHRQRIGMCQDGIEMCKIAAELIATHAYEVDPQEASPFTQTPSGMVYVKLTDLFKL